MPYHLSVRIDPNSGFCFGVIYAIQMAEDLLDEQGYLYCLGDIVHNDEEVERLEQRGLRIINYEELAALRDEAVLIRAHGEPPSTYQMALENNLTLIDASCPVVLKLQNRIKTSFDRKDRIYIYGKHGHAEVRGLLGQTGGEAVVFENLDELLGHELPSNLTLYSQTTKSTDSFYRIKNELEQRGYQVNANDTICRQVSNRDKDLRRFAAQFDQIVFVSGTKSSNGKVLFQVCKDTNPATHFISKTDELRAEWFRPGQSVGICGATSTPMWLMEQVRDALLAL
ncbi:4-hydroxy-3-methylbut-2-enyl diphosphate reductase [Hymenobacter lutimineralis]|uniref:4-hydroxy-3-methylbut-2-enyl diphosphate reductase n=1 Tax=Hymenobacter lutimineralis TaxID=2606448 RepID=A0A5D6UVL4_9BACT|nr:MULTISPECIES: 4-hydroxy-3-methylbut-2-enyl diphosphate reductase [Hymenobacter]QIX62770.1 4-hydroxy-3-methylbut-2-enyl diphosphate reductase [Hymenobacter sp. BT18]TYZ07626.1 4-hydroxy-3-methylbut-2-enyl diphosphate reductase [Hymenobacter lutimineralis]